jgi:hypothetical protein
MLLGFAGLGYAGYRRARAGRATLAADDGRDTIGGGLIEALRRGCSILSAPGRLLKAVRPYSQRASAMPTSPPCQFATRHV